MEGDLTFEQRRALLPQHPISLPRGYTLKTEVGDAYFEAVCEWIAMHISGLCWTGPSDVGKTTVLRESMRRLQPVFPRHAFTWISGEQMGAGVDTQDKFMRMCLEQAKKSGKSSGTDSLCKRLTNYLIQLCMDRYGRTCVLFIDEAQRLRGLHFDFLRNVWNRMDWEGFELLCFSLGNDSLRADKDFQLQTYREDNAARFFAKYSRFQGVTSQEALQSILVQYDEELFFPNPLQPYTRFFAKEAFDQGWRLGAEASILFNALNEVNARRISRDHFAGHEMRIVTRAVHSVLMDALQSDSFLPRTGEIDWKSALSRYRDLEPA